MIGALGRISALVAVGALFALAALAVLLVEPPARVWIGAALAGIFILYRLARRSDGLAVFGAAALPNAITQIAESTIGAPPWLIWALIPVSLLIAWGIDRGTGEAAAFEERRAAT